MASRQPKPAPPTDDEIALKDLRRLFGIEARTLKEWLRRLGVDLAHRQQAIAFVKITPVFARIFNEYRRSVGQGTEMPVSKSHQEGRAMQIKIDRLEGSLIQRDAVAKELQTGLVALKQRLLSAPQSMRAETGISAKQAKQIKAILAEILTDTAAELDQRFKNYKD